MRTASVIVVSNGRCDALRRCLTGIGQLRYPDFEIVIVADTIAIRKIAATSLAGRIKLLTFDAQNISAARNLGIEAAAGEIVAFIDDDAVPEPTWLTHLAAAFDDPAVSAAGGFVRGRNGISWQWKAQSVDRTGQGHPIELNSTGPVVLHPVSGRAIKTEGTNMAFRRDVIARIGGFDPAFRFFLDESDLNMRLARAGHATAIVPLAEVHHGFAASARRRRDRVPRDLFEIGASHSAFLVRHCPQAGRAGPAAAFASEQRQRLLRHMVAGRLEPRDVRRLMVGLAKGVEAGWARTPTALPPLARAAEGIRPFAPSAPFAPRLIAGPWRKRSSIRQNAAREVAAGHVTTAMIFSPTAMFGHVRFTEDGYWEHSCGLFGKLERNEPLFKLRTLKQKTAQETRRIAIQRGLGDMT